jgi:hypothetical protein
LDAFVLIDYDNLPAAIRRAGLVGLAWRIDAGVRGALQGIQDIHIRLYGGWYDAGGLSNAGTTLTQEIGNNFPIVTSSGGSISGRVHCEIASSLVGAKGDVFLFTMRKRRGMRSRLTGQKPPHCLNPAACTIDAVVAWSKGSCPVAGCPVESLDAFTYTEQKLTDTLLCADVLSLAGGVQPPPVFVVSDDDDMTPPILLAAKSGAKICHVRSSANAKFYDGLLRQNNVQLVVL